MPEIRLPRRPRALLAPLALLFVLVPASPARAADALPTISKVSPLAIEIGQTLTITGKNFIPGKLANVVTFKRDGKPVVFVKADNATRTKITVTIPDKIGAFLVDATGAPNKFRFHLRILARKFGKAFTSSSLSPVIATKGTVAGLDQANDCDLDGIPNKDEADDDNDGLSDTQEATYKTDPCKADSDGDGITDYFEVESAHDLNSKALPFPGKKPYPNALDGSDKDVDFDQDGMTLIEEYLMWVYSGSPVPINYSDGDQDTNPTGDSTPVTDATRDLDINGNGIISDDEKDVDGDGITNWDETSGRMRASWWSSEFPQWKPYFGAAGASPLLQPSFVDPDSDGDGVLDGADDQDHDGVANLDEIDAFRVLDIATGAHPLVNPYNPCLPDYLSRACTLHPPFGNPWAPFPLPSPLPQIPLIWFQLLPGSGA